MTEEQRAAVAWLRAVVAGPRSLGGGMLSEGAVVTDQEQLRVILGALDAAEARIATLEATLQRCAYMLHLNVEIGNYLRCMLCNAEGPGGDVRREAVRHASGCPLADARPVSEAGQEGGEGE